MGDKTPLIIVGALIVLGLAGLLLLGGGDGGRRIDRSLIGVHGLGIVARADGIETRQSHPRLSPHIRDLSIRVFALYDTDLTRYESEPETRRDLLYQETQKSIALGDLQTKLAELPTILLLPKWTSGMFELELAHDILLIPDASMRRLLDQIGLPGLEVTRAGPNFDVLSDGRHGMALFHAQTFARASLPANCRAEVADGPRVLVAACDLGDSPYETWIVSDPDLMNNHGLANGDNRAAALALLRARLDGDARPVYLDTSPDLLTAYEETDAERQDYERSPSDLGRFFAYPFNVLWAMLFIVLGVLYWRGARRFGPIAELADQGREMSRTAAIAAKGRLLRLSGNDGQLVADFVRNQLQDLTQQTFGPDLGQAGQKRFFAHLARQDPVLARDFEDTAHGLITNAATLPRADLYRQLGHYKTLLEKVVTAHGSLRISTNR
ncbi:hypothetical protein K1T73_11545 [Roseovarius sp. SCSIO 43702]|uniref:hypothetical protein n=1 Tax=Roseovarius sp. SCSIO 43702 TaxID=2823043 RepID=UPI001C730229|nr:hypothetical protein [Roseovarius sp. SCSIO 43702]QYX55717.1 hypothetical protein K1T73_11545 [Roseovarius sp. SCSIO 43702]